MVLLGCKPPGRFTEQHDLYFGVGETLPSLKESIEGFWPEAEGKLHIDAWRIVRQVDGYAITVVDRKDRVTERDLHLFFVNLGGYRGSDFEEYHYKQLVVATNLGEATFKAKNSQFYREFISPHIDDKYGLDVDDIFVVDDALPADMRDKFQLLITKNADNVVDEAHIGYLKFSALEQL